MQTPKSAGDPPQQPAPSKPDRLHKLEDAGLEAKHDADTPFNPDIPPMSLFREVALVFLVTCVQLYTQAALGAVLAPLHIIGDDLGIYNPGELSWLIAGYSLTVGIFVLPSGRAGDIFGTKFVFLVGIAIFTVFSLILGFSVVRPLLLFVVLALLPQLTSRRTVCRWACVLCILSCHAGNVRVHVSRRGTC